MNKLKPAAYQGSVVAQLPGRILLVAVSGVGHVQARDRSGRAAAGQSVTVLQLNTGKWRIV